MVIITIIIVNVVIQKYVVCKFDMHITGKHAIKSPVGDVVAQWVSASDLGLEGREFRH